jgi:hypothetical protein
MTTMLLKYNCWYNMSYLAKAQRQDISRMSRRFRCEVEMLVVKEGNTWHSKAAKFLPLTGITQWHSTR